MINLQSPWPPPFLNSWYTQSLCLSLFSKFFLYPPLHSPSLLGSKLLESRKQLHTSSHSFNIMLNPSTPNTQWLADFFKVSVLSSSLLSVPGSHAMFSTIEKQCWGRAICILEMLEEAAPAERLHWDQILPVLEGTGPRRRWGAGAGR